MPNEHDLGPDVRWTQWPLA